MRILEAPWPVWKNDRGLGGNQEKVKLKKDVRNVKNMRTKRWRCLKKNELEPKILRSTRNTWQQKGFKSCGATFQLN